jgi:hypothetical protein
MGVDKTSDSNKEYAAGYTDGFAAGIAAGFSATNKLQLGLSDPDANVAIDSSTVFIAEETKAAEITGAQILADKDINSVVETHAVHATETELDIEFLHARSNPFESPAHAIKFEQDGANHPTVTEEELGHLAPGCFVQVGSGDTSYWVEVGQIEGATISGMVHPELSGSLCVVDHDSCEVARFSRDQITALGCDRYCWC